MANSINQNQMTLIVQQITEPVVRTCWHPSCSDVASFVITDDEDCWFLCDHHVLSMWTDLAYTWMNTNFGVVNVYDIQPRQNWMTNPNLALTSLIANGECVSCGMVRDCKLWPEPCCDSCDHENK